MADKGEGSKKFQADKHGNAAEGDSQVFGERAGRKNSAEQTLRPSSGSVKIQRDSLPERDKSVYGMPASGTVATTVLPPVRESAATDSKHSAALKKRLAELDNPELYPRFLDCTFKEKEIKYLLQTSNGTSEWLSFKEFLGYNEFRHVARFIKQFTGFLYSSQRHRDEYDHYVALAAGIMPPAENCFQQDEEHEKRLLLCFNKASEKSVELLDHASMAPEMLKDLEVELSKCVDGNLAKQICQRVLPPTWSDLSLRRSEEENEMKQHGRIVLVNGIRRHASTQAWLKRQMEHLQKVVSSLILDQDQRDKTMAMLRTAARCTVPSRSAKFAKRAITIRPRVCLDADGTAAEEETAGDVVETTVDVERRLEAGDKGSQSALPGLGDVPNEYANGQRTRTAGLEQELVRAQIPLRERDGEELTEDDSILDTPSVKADGSNGGSKTPERRPTDALASPRHATPVEPEEAETPIAVPRGRRASKVQNYNQKALEVSRRQREQASTVRRKNPRTREGTSGHDTPLEPEEADTPIAVKRGRKATKVQKVGEGALEVSRRQGEQAGAVRREDLRTGEGASGHDTPVEPEEAETPIVVAKGRKVSKVQNYNQKTLEISSRQGEQAGTVRANPQSRGRKQSRVQEQVAATGRKRARNARSPSPAPPTRRARLPSRSPSPPPPAPVRRGCPRKIVEQDERFVSTDRTNRRSGNGQSGSKRGRPSGRPK